MIITKYTKSNAQRKWIGSPLRFSHFGLSMLTSLVGYFRCIMLVKCMITIAATEKLLRAVLFPCWDEFLTTLKVDNGWMICYILRASIECTFLKEEKKN